ncbi:MAG TPA: hypothetical protein VHJ76_08665, partial [Actinomycetota bacterium]|nr:hypothetical protein [Actinomycetota bacterium]
VYPELGGSRDEPLESEWLTVRVVAADLPRATIRDLGYERPRFSLAKILKKLICLLLKLLGRGCRRTLDGTVDQARTETISNAPAGSEAWNGTYSWRARFDVRVSEPNCRVDVVVRIRINGTVTDAQRTAWADAITAAWSNRFKLCCKTCCCKNGYVIHARPEFVDSGEHQVVNAGGSTTNMGNWGVDDTVDVNHEFGHMLGALDEYFTVNGVDYGPGRQPGGNIMNNPANDPVARHYDLVRDAVARLLGSTCRTVEVAERC